MTRSSWNCWQSERESRGVYRPISFCKFNTIEEDGEYDCVFMTRHCIPAFNITPMVLRTPALSLKALRAVAAISSLTLVLFSLSAFASSSPTAEADTVIATQAGGRFGIENHAIRATVSVVDGSLRGLIVADREHGTELHFAEPFAILLKDGTILDTNSLKLIRPPERRVLTPRPDASRLAERLHGGKFDFYFENNDHSVRVSWSLILLDGSHYLRQLLTIEAPTRDAAISRVQLIDVRLPAAHVEGSVNGSPIAIARNFFLGFEHPLSQSRVNRQSGNNVDGS